MNKRIEKHPTNHSSHPRNEEALHPIQVAARRTAVTPDVIRAWERRYGAVVPRRSSTNRRLYTDEDIQRLKLLNQAVGLGRRIGDIAHLALADLIALLNEDRQAIEQAPEVFRREKTVVTEAVSSNAANSETIEACLAAITELNPPALEANLTRAAINCSPLVLLEGVISRVLQIVGQRWQEGHLRLCHEHMASGVIRSFLGTMLTEAADNTTSDYAPVLLVTTPDGQRHELGALMVALVAASKGWQPLYLGPNTPVDEILYSAMEKSAKAVALSICYPADDPRLPAALKKLRRQLSQEVSILAGGASAGSYREILDEIRALCPPDLNSLQNTLDDLRERSPVT